MRKVCAHWVPWDLTPEQKQMWVQKCRELLVIHNEDPDGFFARLVTGKESWFHYHTPSYKLVLQGIEGEWYMQYKWEKL
jgi:hypothetical protein